MNIVSEEDQSKLDSIDQETDVSASKFSKEEHDSKSRLEITKLFLKAYFWLIGGSFIFCLVYNYGAALINSHFKLDLPIKYVDVTNTVSIITTTLSGGMGFVIGFYFKNKD